MTNVEKIANSIGLKDLDSLENKMKVLTEVLRMAEEEERKTFLNDTFWMLEDEVRGCADVLTKQDGAYIVLEVERDSSDFVHEKFVDAYKLAKKEAKETGKEYCVCKIETSVRVKK